MARRYAACLLLAVIAAGNSAAQDDTEYYAIFLDGRKIGHATRSRNVAADRVVTTENIEMTIGRGALPITASQSETCIETPGGGPLGFETAQGLGPMVQKTKGTVLPDGKVSLETTPAGQGQARTFDWPVGALMAEGLRLLTVKNGLTAGTAYEAKVFVPTMMKAADLYVTVGPAVKVDLLGRVVSLTEIKTRLPSLTGEMVTTSYVNRLCRPLKTVMPVMGTTVEMIACDKAFALGANDLVDFLAKTILPCPVPLKGIEAASAATYHLAPAGQSQLDGMISTDSQRARPDGEGGLIVEVSPAKAPAGAKLPYAGKEPAALAAMQPTRWVQSDDEQVIALARQAVGKAADAGKAAKKIEAFVARHITKKNLSVGYATAAEVAVGREGDCSEHAVLTAAMCRAVGIPARVVVGYVYAEQLMSFSNVFGPHAWAEACVGGKWIGLDATRLGVGPGHIAQTVGNGDPADFFGMITSMGSFKIVGVTIHK